MQSSFVLSLIVTIERSVGSSHPYRRAAVCLGLLCALLLTAALVLCVLYTSQYQTYLLLESELEGLQRANNVLKEERNQLETNYTRLKTERDNSIFQLVVSNKLLFIDQYCPISSQKRECKPCPQGWEQFHSKCYFFSKERKNWTESRNDCIKRGADLVIIENQEEQDFITGNSIYDNRWIGLSDSVTEGTWIWVDGSPLQGGFWRSGQPDDCDGQDRSRGADCVANVLRHNVWFDTHCNKVKGFICENDALLP